jgi:ABC-type Na+ efflux pump permease subunit
VAVSQLVGPVTRRVRELRETGTSFVGTRYQTTGEVQYIQIPIQVTSTITHLHAMIIIMMMMMMMMIIIIMIIIIIIIFLCPNTTP